MNITAEQRAIFSRLHAKKVNDIRVLKDEEYIGLFAEAIDKYADTAHFVYELLQNADDANATDVSIILKQDKLIFKHNGTKHFDITDRGVKPQGDINAITGIGFSNKKNDLSTQNKIGKFGLGFKSVLQYTDTPEIYDDVFKFKIEDMIVPTLLEYDYPDRNDGETLFVLPFKKEKVAQCFKEIKDRLQGLENPLLFLNNLQRIVWRIDQSEQRKGDEFSFNKILVETIEYDNNIALHRFDLKEPAADKHIFLFSRNIKIENTMHKIYVGFYYDKANKCLLTEEKQMIHCFFPTNETFDTCFVTHAPFLLTNSRQNLKPSEDVNDRLLTSLASLATDAVICLRDYGIENNHLLVNENIADIIPQYSGNYRYGQSYEFEEIMADAFKEMLEEEPILLSRNDKYLKANEAYISVKAIYDQLTQEQFVLLHGVIQDDDEDDYYDDEDEDEDENEEENIEYNENVDFLKWELRMRVFDLKKQVDFYDDVEEYTIEDFAKDITESFMDKQKLDWVSRFYTFLRNEAPKYWKITPQTKTTAHIFRDAPIIKTQSGEWVQPFINTTTPNVFIPLNSEQAANADSGYHFIHEDYLKDKMSIQFFNELELKTPDEYDYITAVILDRYRHSTVNMDGVIEDFTILVKYYNKVKDDEQKLNEYLTILRRDLCLLRDDNVYDRPSNMYFCNPILKRFFKNCSYVHFLDEKFYVKIYSLLGNINYRAFFEAIGVARYPRIKNVYYSGFILDQRTDSLRNCAEKRLLADYQLEGLTTAIGSNCIDKEVSIFLWNDVIPQIDLPKYKEMSVQYRQKYSRNYQTAYFDSEFIEELKTKKWIYDKDGELKTATEIHQEDLASEYNLFNGNIQLFNIHKFEQSIKEKYGATDDEDRQQQLGKEMEEASMGVLSKDEMKAALAKAAREKQAEIARANQQSAPHTPSDQSAAQQEQQTVEPSEEESIEDKLNRKLEEKKNRKVGKPHSKTTEDGDMFFDHPAQENLSKGNSEPSFVKPTIRPHQNESDEIAKAEKSLKTKDTSAQTQAENAKEQIQYLELLKQTQEYTFRWFKILMLLMHAGQDKSTKRQTQIDFYSNQFENGIIRLSNPTMPIPAWIGDAEKCAISAMVDNQSTKIDGLISRLDENSVDVVIRKDEHDSAKDYLRKCIQVEMACKSANKFRIIAVDNTNIIDSLETRFLQLEKEDDYDMNANLPSNISFIYGPPGTGKTTALVQRVHDLLVNEPDAKILVLTPTNKAADVVAIKMSKDNVCEGGLARYGATESIYLSQDENCVTNRDNTDMEMYNIVVATAARYAYDFVQPDDTPICDYPWDYIFIDEASMIDILTITYILHKGADVKHIVISGDPKQIQPVAQNDMPAYNIYTMVGLNGFAEAIDNFTRFEVIPLFMQHRSTPIIGDLVSNFAYDGRVAYDPERAPQKPLKLDGIHIEDVNFLEFEVADLDEIKGLNAVGNSAFNLYSVIFTYNMVEYTIRQIEKHFPNKKYSIGVVCAYRAQSDAIKNMLENRPLDTDYCNVSCGTVHSFQGDECDIMFIVLNPPAECTSGAHVNNENIINVAMSRARDYIFFVLPKGQQKGFYMKNVIGDKVAIGNRSVRTCREIERVMFQGNDNFIYENTHVTCHMPVNVYCEDNALYEVRMSDEALDIKINQHLLK